MNYLHEKKRNRKLHIAGTDGMSLCNVEKSRKKKRKFISTDFIPEGRKVCGICDHLFTSGERINPNKAKQQYTSVSRKPKSASFYMSIEWKRLRYKVLLKYGGKCMACGSTDRIVVDHIKPRVKYPKLELDIGNMQVLCNDCNLGKGAWDETDWRPIEYAELEIVHEAMQRQ